MFTYRACALASALVLGIWAGTAPANATPLFTFGFTELAGSFDEPSAQFSAVAADADPLRTAGDVTRAASPPGTADYDDGFVSGMDSADFELTMTLSNITPTSADVLDGDGSFTITDQDGDTITGSVSGIWTLQNLGFIVFSGTMDDITLNDADPSDGTFDGPNGGSFSMDFSPAVEPFTGSAVMLVAPSGTFFDDGSFSNLDTLIIGQVIPEPVTLLLMVLGGGVAVLWRRRGWLAAE